MHRTHTTVVAALIALAAVAGAFAVVRTTGLGSSARHANDAAVAAKTRQLAAYERELRRALAARTPALPPAPAATSARPAQASPQRVIYHRPPPVVVVTHSRHGDDGSEAERGGGSDD